jgi:pimeloyl-ACP methyl ester carboxylesterase
MAPFVPWDSQPIDEWARQHAAGKFVDLDDQPTHYVERGSGEPVILIHGFVYDWFTWHNNIDALSERYKVYALDLYGFGYSSRAPLDHGYPLYVEQVLRFMDVLQIPRASLVGHSMGGGTGIAFAVQHRERVNKLILVDPAGMPGPLPLIGRLANLPGVGELLYGVNLDLTRRLTLQRMWFHNGGHVTDVYYQNATRFHKVQGTTPIMLRILRKRFFHTLRDEVRALGQTDVPILLVWGRQDRSVPFERGLEMHALLPRARLEVFEQMGHCPHDERPGRFNELALEFLDR